MFKKTKRRIVAVVMSVLVLLWVGTLGVIYASSYMQMRKQNQQMLQAHADMYTLPQGIEGIPDKPAHDGEHGFKPGFDPNSPEFQLSLFYSVALAPDGQVLDIRNESPTVYSDDLLAQLARQVVSGGKSTGVQNNLSFLRVQRNDYVLVAFMDNTVVNESAMTLFHYTLIFGGVALVLFFFLSVFLADRIVAPLEENDKKQRRFISDAGHELKTPISVVSANAELLTRELGDSRWLQNIQYENARMGVLVEQLLELARTEHVAIQPQQLDMSRLVAGEALPFESVAYEKGLALSADIAPGIMLEGDGAQLKQLVAILLDNAMDHSTAQGLVRLKLSKERGMVELFVINPAEEIPPQHRERIFERFYRADPVRNGESKHYGLGLSIAKAIVEAHRGHIEVRCYNGLVEFCVSLPALREK